MRDWTAFAPTAPVMKRLAEDPLAVETRDLLRPLFRLCKEASSDFDFEAAFQFTDFMVALATTGSAGFPSTPHVQPKYAFNTLVVMAQRMSRADYALRAHASMLSAGYTPDVFTLTALIDVTGRHRSLAEALGIFESMFMSSNVLPNIVTFVTLLRLAGASEDSSAGLSVVDQLLIKARELQTLSSVGGGDYTVIAGSIATDISLYNAALAACVRLSSDASEAIAIIALMRQQGVQTNTLTAQILAKLCVRRFEGALPDTMLTVLLEAEVQEIKSWVHERSQRVFRQNDSRPAYSGCLGPEASPGMRESVIRHDVLRLLDRVDPLLGGDPRHLSEHDFATLVHQARKRKWGLQVGFIFDFLHALSEEGYPLRGILPQTQLTPTCIMFEACINAYFDMGLVPAALTLYTHITEEAPSAFEEAGLIYGFIKGAVHNGAVDAAVDCYRRTRTSDAIELELRLKLLRGLMRGLGRRLDLALPTLLDVVCLLRVGLVDEGVVTLSVTLLAQSIALVGSLSDLVRLLDGAWLQATDSEDAVYLAALIQRKVLNRDPALIVAGLTGTLSAGGRIEAGVALSDLQSKGLLPRFVFIDAILHEAYLMCPSHEQQASIAAARSTLPFRGFALHGAYRVIDSRLPLLRELLLILDDPLQILLADYHHLADTVEGGDVAIDRFLVTYMQAAKSLAESFCLTGEIPRRLGVLMLHRLHTLLTCVRSREAREELECILRTILTALSDEVKCQLVAACVAGSEVGALDIPARALAKALHLFVVTVQQVLVAVGLEDLTGLVCKCLRDLSPSLEVVKELCKLFRLDGSEEGRISLAACLLAMLVSNAEKPSRVMQFVSQLAALTPIFPELLDMTLLPGLLAESASCDANEYYACQALVGCLGDRDRDAVAMELARGLQTRGCDDLACRLLLSSAVDTSSDENLHTLLHATSSMMYNSCSLQGDPGETCLAIPERVIVTVVDRADQLQGMSAAFQSSRVVGLDVEWRPDRQAGAPLNKCSLLQLATELQVFLIDLLAFEDGVQVSEEGQREYRGIIQQLLQNGGTVKAGFGFAHDYSRLRMSYPLTFPLPLASLRGVVDLRHRACGEGLSRLTQRILGLPLDKGKQRSDWEARPLSAEQIEYAAIDAYALVLIWRALSEKKSEDV